jgi:ribulose-5-phosphate 4-epimerase/fuculose-1-phosphate aldolase
MVKGLGRLREEVFEANWGIYRAGLVTMHSGNASGIDRQRGCVVIKPSGMDCLTAAADEFGGEIPCAPYVDNVGNHIGEVILKHRTQAPAVLLGHHGVFTFGPNPRAAFKTAVMVEDVARTCHLASLLGNPSALPPEEVQKWYVRYHSSYGQLPKEKRARRTLRR